MKSKINRDSWENQTSDCIIIKESNDFMVGVRGRKLRGDPGERVRGTWCVFFPLLTVLETETLKLEKGSLG